MHQELHRKGMTLMLLGEEHPSQHPVEPMLRYAQFCVHDRNYAKRLKRSTLRTIDTWYPGVGVLGPIAVEPYGSVTTQAATHKQKGPQSSYALRPLYSMAPRPGLEPGTCGLTVRRSTN